MRNVTNVFFEYLEAKRHLWNTYFVQRVSSIRECGPLDRYETIDRLLFSALVLDGLDQPEFDRSLTFGRDPLAAFRVVPRHGVDRVNVMIADPAKGANRAWNRPAEIGTKGTEFIFIEFFEWNRYSYVSYPYYMTRITKCTKFPDYVGRDCLIETKDADVFLAKTKELASKS